MRPTEITLIEPWRTIAGAKWLTATAIVAGVDGAFLGGIAAIISAIGTLLLGVLAYWKGHSAGRATEADAWRQLAELRGERLEELRHADDPIE